jgi:hypothetical protein
MYSAASGHPSTAAYHGMNLRLLVYCLVWGKVRRDIHCAGAKNADTQVLVLDGIGLHADRRASKGVRLGEVLGSGAEHGADLGSGRHFDGCGCC